MGSNVQSIEDKTDQLNRQAWEVRDIGRVFRNLFSNAFYSVNEKKKQQGKESQDYEPTIPVSTRKLTDKIQIMVRDNGKGISPKVLDKIFHHSLQQNQPVKEQDWGYRCVMILSPKNTAEH